MGRKKKEKQSEIDLIPMEMEETEETLAADVNPASEETDSSETDVVKENVEAGMGADNETVIHAENGLEDDAHPREEEVESESSALFGAYVAEETKWERKNRIREEKQKAKLEKKRAKYAEVDDDAYEQMKAGGVHKTFGVLSLLLLIVGIAAVGLFVYKLVIAPSYAQVGEKEKNLHVEGFATDTDTSKYEQQAVMLQGIATPSDLVDTWVEEPYELATPGDGETETQDMDGAEPLPAEETAQPVVVE